MNYVIIKYTDRNCKAEISINGEKISAYSDMTALINRPFHEIADRIIKGIDQEIFDDYEMEFLGTDFQYEVLKHYQSKSEYCKKIIYVEKQSNEMQEWSYTYLLGLAQKYHLQMQVSPKINIYSIVEEVLAEVDKKYAISGREEANVEIISSLEGIESSPVECFVLLEDEYNFRLIGEKKVFGLPINSLNSFCDYYMNYCLLIPQIESVINHLKYLKLEAVDLKGLQVVLEGKEDFYLGELPTYLEEGEEAKIQFESFPSDAFTLRIKGDGLSLDTNGTIKVRGEGKGIVEIVDFRKEVVFSSEIIIVHHNYVEEIRLISAPAYLHSNEKSKIEIVVIPEDAEDANSLKWEMEDCSIAHIKENGEIIALVEGKTKLRISGIKAVREVVIEVKPVVKELRFKNSGVRIKQGESMVVECEVVPPNAPYENLKWTFDNEVIAAITPSYDKKKCKIQAKMEHSGRGNLRCIDQKQNVSAVCNVEIVQLKKAGALVGCTMAALGMGFACMPFMTPIATILSIIGLKCTERASDKKTFKTSLIISVIQLIIWAIIIVLAND